MPEVRLAAVATLEAEPTTTFETVSTAVEPSTGADPDSHAVDSREAAAVPAEPALSTPRMPRPRPADAVIVFARAATPSEPAGLGVPEGTFDALFGTLADDHSLVAFFIPAREIVSPAASTVNKSPAAGPGPEVRLAAIATLEAEPTKALETASTVDSSAAAGPGPEVRLAAVATLEAEPTKALEIASTVAQASAAALLEMPGVQAAAIAMPDAEPTKALEIVSTAVEPSGAGPGPEARLAAVATLEAEPTKALEIATVAQASAAADQVPEVRLAAVATLEAEPTTTFETVSTTVEPSTGADPDSHAVDSREAAAVPAEPALSTPRMPRPRPEDAVIVFASPNLPGPVERSDPEPPRPEGTTAPQGQPASQAGIPAPASPRASVSVLTLPPALLPQASMSALALPPALLPLLPPRSTNPGSALN